MMARAASMRSDHVALVKRRQRSPRHCQVLVAAGRSIRSAVGSEILEERRRIARDLHDSAAQLMGAVLLHIQGAEELLAGGGSPEEARERLALTVALARESVYEVRRTVSALRDPDGDATYAAAFPEHEELPEALQRVVRRVTANVRNIVFRVRVVGRRHSIPASAGLELLRIAQEAVTNVVKHSEARRAEVRLEYGNGGAVSLKVTDDGRGFDPAAMRGTLNCAARFGLAGMGERAAVIGACLSVASAPGRGTQVIVHAVCPLTVHEGS